MPKKTTSIKIDPAVWKEIKKHCIDKDMDISDFIETLAKKELRINKN